MANGTVTAMFVGPDDDESCDGCSDAVAENPYTLDDVPEPGSFECMSRCRHMIQLGEDAPDDIPTFTWKGTIGFYSDNATYYTDTIPDQDLDTGYPPLPPESPDLATPIILGGEIVVHRGHKVPYSSDEENPSQVAQGIGDDAFDVESADPTDIQGYAEAVWSDGMDPTDAAFEAGYTGDQMGEFLAEYAKLAYQYVDENYVRTLLADADVDTLSAILTYSPELRTLYEQIGSQGFGAAQAEQAQYLASALGKKATELPDGTWVVK